MTANPLSNEPDRLFGGSSMDCKAGIAVAEKSSENHP